MALNICIEYFWRFLFGLIKYSLDNVLFIIIALIITIAVAKKFGPLIIGILATLIDFLKDSVDIGTLGISTPITILVGIGIGFLWASMAFSSSAPILISFINAIPMFLFGLILGIAPIPLAAPLSALVGFLLHNFRGFNYLVGFFSAALLYFALSLSFSIISGFCQGLDYAISLF